MPIEVQNLVMALMGLNLLFFVGSAMMLMYHGDQLSKAKHDIQEMKNSMEIARDRVSYLYDQVSRVETKVDVKDTLEDIKETIEAFQEDNRDPST